MPTMFHAPRPLSRAARMACIGLAALALLWAAATSMPGSADARKAKRVYYFLVSEVKLTEGIPNEIATLVRERLERAITRHERLIDALPAGAPDPKVDEKGFARYIKQRKIKPFRINVEIIEYSHEVEEAPRGGQQLVVSLALRTFGETIPQRVMAFSGEGSAKLKMEIGKTLRPRDTRVANKDAAEIAIEEALEVSLRRLEAPPKKKKKAKKKKRRQKK